MACCMILGRNQGVFLYKYRATGAFNHKNMIAQVRTFIVLLMFQDLENYTPLLMGLYQGVVGLHDAYQVSVAMEDIDK